MSSYNSKFAELLSRLSTAMNQLGEPMRAKAYKTAEESILSMTQDIHSIDNLNNQPGIGPTIKTKLQEYLDTGKIKVLEEHENRPEVILSEVYGIGPKKAKELVQQGITTIQQLREQQDKVLNAVQKKGLIHYEDILKRIPRSEIILYDKYFASVLKCVYDTEAKYDIVGSYRREQASSGDIDVIITSSNSASYDMFLDALIESKLITEVLSRGKHKCLVIAKIPESTSYRRLDFLYAPPNEYAFSVLYFTGSKGFNVVMRGHALKQGFSLNEHGFTPTVSQEFPDEKSIFDFLNLQYIEPKNRIDGRAVVQKGFQKQESENIGIIQSQEPIIPQKNYPKKQSKKKEKQGSQKRSKKKHQENRTEIIESSPSNIEDMKKLITQFKERGLPVLEALSESKLKEMIKVTDDAYFNQTPLLTDNEYDIVKEYASNKYSKLEKVGAPITGKNKVKLPFEMPSMDKIKPDSGALDSWKVKYKGPYVLSCKLDGVSGLYTCGHKGKYKLYTRGDGLIGQDISHLIPTLRLPQIPVGTAVRGEFILPKKVFKEKYSAEFANARNLVSGIINRKTTDEKAKDLQFVTYEVIEPHLKPSDQIQLLEREHFQVVQHIFTESITNNSLSDLLVEWREKYDYEIDGVIVTNDSIYLRTSGNPEYAFAFKMVLSDQVAEAKVVDVIWQASKNGFLKPRVRIEPISLGGVKIEYATGFNGKFIQDNKIGIGAVITMVRSGDVIPYIKSVTTPAEKAHMPLVPYIWNKTNVDVILENPHEDAGVKEKNITMFFTTLEVDGLAKGNVKKLYKSGKKTVADILKMSSADFEIIEGFQKKTADKLFNSIREKIANATLLDIMVASGKLGRGLGERKITPILQAYPDILTSKFSESEKEQQLKSVQGIGDENSREFVKNIPDFLAFLKECQLEDKLVENQQEPVKETKSGPLFEKKIVMTKIRDKDIISFMTEQGAILENSMKKDIMVLIVKSKEDKSNKTEYAEKNGIPIMTAEEFKRTYMSL